MLGGLFQCKLCKSFESYGREFFDCLKKKRSSIQLSFSFEELCVSLVDSIEW